MQKTGIEKAGSEIPHVSMSHHLMLEAGLSSAHACATFLNVEKEVRVRGLEEVGSSAFGELFTPSLKITRSDWPAEAQTTGLARQG